MKGSRILLGALVVVGGCATFRRDLGDSYGSATMSTLLRIDPECDRPKSKPTYEACEAAADILSYGDPRTATVAFLSTWEEFALARPANTRQALYHQPYHSYHEPDPSPALGAVYAVAGVATIATMHGDNKRKEELVNVVIPAIREVYARSAATDPYAAQMAPHLVRLSIESSASMNAFAMAHALALNGSPGVAVASAATATVSAERENADGPMLRAEPTPIPRPEGNGPLFLKTQRAGMQEVEAGRRVEVTLAPSGEKVTGTLVGVAEYGVALEADGDVRILATREIAQVYRAK